MLDSKSASPLQIQPASLKSKYNLQGRICLVYAAILLPYYKAEYRALISQRPLNQRVVNFSARSL